MDKLNEPMKVIFVQQSFHTNHQVWYKTGSKLSCIYKFPIPPITETSSLSKLTKYHGRDSTNIYYDHPSLVSHGTAVQR